MGIVLAVIGNIALLHLGHPWMAGFWTGILLTMWVALRELVPDRIDYWARGADGEKKTKRRIDRLPPEWSAYHDLDTGHGNIDHLVVGPGGLFVLDSKTWRGTITVTPDIVTIQRWGDPRGQTWSSGPVVSLAVQTRDRIKALTKINQFVTPVVVVWGDFPQGVAEVKGVTFVHGDRLVEWLMARPVSIHSTVLDRIRTAVLMAWKHPLDPME